MKITLTIVLNTNIPRPNDSLSDTRVGQADARKCKLLNFAQQIVPFQPINGYNFEPINPRPPNFEHTESI